MAKRRIPPCDWLTLRDALKAFVSASHGTQGTEHIRRMHWYVACRLVVEGGFHPDLITPHPPFKVSRVGKRAILTYDQTVATAGEATVYGGLKTKDIDVVVAIPGIGPCLAVSMKGMLKAFRNLTNRLEEAVGDCTNIHITYPALVYGFLHLLRANREGPVPTDAPFLEPDANGNVKLPDLAIRGNGTISELIVNYHQALARLTGRRDLRNDLSRYEAISVVLVSPDGTSAGEIVQSYPDAESPLLFTSFFETLYRQYELRFIYSAASLKPRTRRLTWDPDSPALRDARAQDVAPRITPTDEAPIPLFEVEPANATDETDPITVAGDAAAMETDAEDPDLEEEE